MITMNDYLCLLRRGVDLFNLTEETAIEAFKTLKFESLAAFVNALSIFFTGRANAQAAAGEGRSGGSAKVTKDEVFEVLSIVPDWRALTWFEAVNIANKKYERLARERSFILCAIHNAHAARRSDIKTPADFNPIEKQRKAEEIKRLKAEAGITAEEDTKRLLKALGGGNE